MPLPESPALARRHARIRQTLESLSLDALVVTAPTNIRYLTNHTGTAGIAVMTREAVHLLDRKSTRLNSSHVSESRMPSSA